MRDTCAASSQVRFGFSAISPGGSLQIEKVQYHPVKHCILKIIANKISKF